MENFLIIIFFKDVQDVLCANEGLYIKLSSPKQLHLFKQGRLIVSGNKWDCRDHQFASEENRNQMGQTLYRMIKSEPVEVSSTIYFIETSKDMSFLSCFHSLKLKLQYVPDFYKEQIAASEPSSKRFAWEETLGFFGYNYNPATGRANQSLVPIPGLNCSNCYIYFQLGFELQIELSFFWLARFEMALTGKKFNVFRTVALTFGNFIQENIVYLWKFY